MPELPEVEDAAKRLRHAVLCRTIATVRTYHPAIARALSTADCRQLTGRKIAEVVRRAKMQLVTLDDGSVLEVHFRMTGDWVFGRADEEPPAYERLRLTCIGGTRVSLVDSRALAVVRLHAPGQMRLPKLGPEPLEDAFTVDVFAASLAKKGGPIKPTLLDQSVIAGIGNIYAAEVLWVAQIHPKRRAASVSRVRVKMLHAAVREVLGRALGDRYYARDGTATIDDAWHVYGREGASCARCGRTIRRITQAGRSTYYCGGCQR